MAPTQKKSSIRMNCSDSAHSHRLTPKEDVDLSVVIPTYNRANQLNNCLGNLFKQNYPPRKYEVIVVDDNSNDVTPEVLHKYSIKYPNLKVIRSKERKGSYQARELGVSLSKGEIVVLTDDDCLFPSDWLMKIEKAFQSPEVSCVQGTQQFRGKFPSLEPEGEFYLKMHQRRWSLDTKNLAIRRNLMLKYGFDKALTLMGDRELGLRLATNNIEITYDPHISVVHVPNHSFKDNISRAKNWGIDYLYIHKKYGWEGSNPRFRYPFPLLLFFYLASFPYFLLKLRSLRGTIAFISMLIVVGLYFKRAIRKMRAS